jgi:putative DNA primase/helicase
MSAVRLVTRVATAAAAVAGLEPFRATDLWAGKLFVRLYGHRVRFCKKRGGWFVYDGKRWLRAETGEIERLAKELPPYLLRLAADETDTDRRGGMAKCAAQLGSVQKLRAVLEMASTEEGVCLAPTAFDADPFKFNVQNGTLVIDSKKATVRLQKHRPEDLITNISPAEWRGIDAPAPRYMKFLSESSGGDQELMGFRQRFAGYALTGDTRERVFEYAYGPTEAGKGTDTHARTDVMGGYARATEMTTFLEMRSDKTRNDLARLAGARLVVATETPEGRAFNEELIKKLTGQDIMSARFLFKEIFEFRVTFKIRFEGNRRPQVRTGDGAFWSRVRIIPFEHSVPESKRDRLLGEKLQSPEERAGILAWMVRGCLDWLRSGLRVPQKVKAAVAEYREAEDQVARFLDEMCDTGEGRRCLSVTLYQRYNGWALTRGETPYTSVSFGMRLDDKGFHRAPDHRTRLGLSLRTGG